MTMDHHAVPAVLALVLGSCVGSFLNVCVHRIPLGLSLVHPPSRCPRCQTRIPARDNLPVIGWLLLRGKCRHCREPISPRYPLIELAVGLVFAAIYLGGVALAGQDLWEDFGGGRVMAGLFSGWAMAAFALVTILIEWDRRHKPQPVKARAATAGRRAAGSNADSA